MLITTDDLREKLLRIKNPKTSWGQIAALLYPEYENKSYLRVVLYRIAKDGYDPKDNRMREALGLPQRFEVYACVICGKPHTTGCPQVAPPPPLPQRRPKASKPRPPRIAIRKDDIDSAERTMRANLEPEYLQELVSRLISQSND